MSKVSELLKHLGFKEDFISQITADEVPDDFDWMAEADTRIEEVIQLHNQKNPPNIDEQLKAARIAGAKDVKQSLGRAFGITKTRTELEQMDNKEFVSLLTATHEESVKKGTSDEKLKAELDEFRNKYLTLSDEFEDFKSVSDRKIQEAQEKALHEVRSFKVNQVMDSAFNSIEWGVPKGAVPALVKGFKAQISEMPWTILEDGTLTGPNGSGLAIDFTGKGHFKHISEAINALAFEATKKSNGDGGGRPVGHGAGFVPADDTQAKAVAELEARMGLR